MAVWANVPVRSAPYIFPLPLPVRTYEAILLLVRCTDLRSAASYADPLVDCHNYPSPYAASPLICLEDATAECWNTEKGVE